MKYYHNTRCRKSREGLELLKEKGVEPEVLLYMNEPITQDELKGILTKLGISAEQLIRKTEKVWKEEFKDKELTNEELILVMIEYPNLMERPILVNGDNAAIGRPSENLLKVI